MVLIETVTLKQITQLPLCVSKRITWAMISFCQHIMYRLVYWFGNVILLGGGLTANNQWRDKGEEFFLPVKVLSKLFRGKYLDELKILWEENKLQFHGSSVKYRNHYAFKELLNTCYEKDWIPHCKKTFNGASLLLTILVSTHIESLSVITESSVWTKILLHTM